MMTGGSSASAVEETVARLDEQVAIDDRPVEEFRGDA